MNTVPNIAPGSITGMTGLSSRPVFFLRLNGSPTPNLVVKGENKGSLSDTDGSETVKWGSKLMKNVNNNLVNTKIMTGGEVTVFQAAARASFAPNSQQLAFATLAPYRWVKMPFVAGLSDADFYDDNNNVSLAAVKRNIAKLSDDAVWTELGKVVAVDIFNGNGDRFNITTGEWVNKGNIMFLTGGATKVIGLDTFDPASDHSNLARSGGYDELRTLIDPTRRRKFATDCAKSVGTEFKIVVARGHMSAITFVVNGPNGPAQVRVDTANMPDMFLPYAPNFEAGLAQGATDLKNYLQAKVRQYNNQWTRARPTNMAPRIGGARAAAHAPARKTIPQGILERMQYLGWNV